MTAIPSFAFSDMSASHFDDKMDVASSPFRQADDIDIDLDSVRDPSVIGSVHDEMIDDSAMPADPDSDVMQHHFDEALADDDMFDDTTQDAPAQLDTDYNMDGPGQDVLVDEDEDILYEDEEVATPLPAQNEGIVEYHDDQAPETYQEPAAEVILEELDHNPAPQEQDNLATNDPETLHTSSGPITGDELANNLEQDQSLEISQDYLGEQTEDPHPQQVQVSHDDELEEYLEQPEHSGVDEPSSDQQNDVQEIQDAHANAEPESGARAGVENPEEEHERSTTGKEADNVAKPIHPVTVVYLDDEMSLFPPMLGDTSSVYFLSDSTLASQPLERLLAECREILGHTLDHHDELVLDVPSLGLHICEDSKYAAQITLTEILDVYLHLCRNDGGREAQPLYCFLSSRVSLASQYAYLASAGVEGKTYADIAADHWDSPEPQGENAETFDEIETQHDDSSLSQSEGGVDTREQEQHGQTTAHDLEEPAQTSIPTESDPKSVAPAVVDTDGVPALDADPDELLVAPETAEQLDLHEETYAQQTEQEHADEQSEVPESANDELAEVPEDADALDEDAEDGSNSSHTLEGDSADATHNTSAEIPGVENPGLYDYDEQGEDLFHSEEGTLEPQPEYERYGDDELFNAEGENTEVIEQDTSADPSAVELSTTAHDTSEHNLSQDIPQVPGSDEVAGQAKPPSTSAADALVPGNLSPPLTPKQDKQAKRKAEDDDEFLLLDLDTPDPKRQRSS